MLLKITHKVIIRTKKLITLKCPHQRQELSSSTTVVCLRRPATPPTPRPTPRLYPPAPGSGRDRVALMFLTCLRSRLGRRPFQLRKAVVGGLVGSCAGRTFHSHAGLHASCTVANGTQGHSLYCSSAQPQVPGGESETQSSQWKSHRCVSGSSDVCTRRYLEQNALKTSSFICAGLSVASRNCGLQSLFTLLHSSMQRQYSRRC